MKTSVLVRAGFVMIVGVGLTGSPVVAQSRPGNPPLIFSQSDRRLAADVLARLAQMPAAEVAGIGARGTPTHLRGNFGRFSKTGRAVDQAEIRAVVAVVAPLFRLDPADLETDDVKTDELGFTHVRFRQKKNGLPVVGTRLALHANREGVVYAVSGNARDGENLPVRATVRTADATSKALAGRGADVRSDAGRLVYLASVQDQSMHLAWEVRVDGRENGKPVRESVFIDAVSGAIIECHSHLHHGLNREIYSANYGYGLPGTLVRDESQQDPIGDDHVDQNFDRVKDSHDYYSQAHSRDSFDGAGATIKSTVHYGAGYANAFWDGTQIVFGDGDGSTFGPLGVDSDIVTHELTHGVTERESGLIYSGECGALNESFSDVFAAAQSAFTSGISSNTWLVAEESWTPGTGGDALRYMDNPAQDGFSADWYPNRRLPDGPFPGFPNGWNDWGRVHANSGIGNLAFKLMVTGGYHPRAGQWVGTPQTQVSVINVPSLGLDPSEAMQRARTIFYRANTVYLGPGAQFSDTRIATAQAALDYAAQWGEDVSAAVHLAWDAVGVPNVSGNRHPINFSTRVRLLDPSESVITGLTMGGGSSPKQMLLRAIGPTLAQFGVANAMGNPALQLGGLFNDNWSDRSEGEVSAIEQVTSQVGAFALARGSLDANLLTALSPGVYSMVSWSVDGGTGEVMNEIYDTDPANLNHLLNISTRSPVTASTPLIGGMVVNGAAYKWLLIRAVGPTLANFGISNYLPNPTVRVFFAGSSSAFYTNFEWESTFAPPGSIAEVGQRVGAFALNSGSADAALLVGLPPGTYTIEASSADGGSGQCLLEVYEAGDISL